jgi:hypothetical protein
MKNHKLVTNGPGLDRLRNDKRAELVRQDVVRMQQDALNASNAKYTASKPTDRAPLLDIDNSRSYKSEQLLMVALRNYGLDTCRPLIVRNRAGRYTAVFGVSFLRGNVTAAARCGFMTIN